MKQKNLLLIAVVLFSAVVMAGVQGMTSSYELQGVNDLSINQRRSDTNGDAVNCELRWDVDAENVYRKSVSDNSVELVSTNLSWVGLENPVLKQTAVTATSEFAFAQIESGEDAYVDFIVTPSKGYTFTPSGISFKVSRFGTNGPTIDVLWLKQDGTSQTLLSGIAPKREKPSSSNVQEEIDLNEDYLVVTLTSEDLAAITTYSGTGRMRVVFNNLSWGKNIGFADVKITGVLQGNEGEEEVDPLIAIVTKADVPVSFTNDETYPWTIVDGNTVNNGNCGVRYSSSTLTMNYTSSNKTELSFDWLCRDYNYHSLRLFVDGVQTNSTTSNSYNTVRFYVEPGQHIIVFKDSIGGNSTSTNNYSYIKNVKIKEILPLENAVLTEKSQPLTFTNDGTWPWTIEDGYIQNSNYGTANSVSKFSTTFEIDKPSKFSFQRQVTPYDNYWNSVTNSYLSYQYLYTFINGETYMTDCENEWQNCSVMLEPGKYTIEWVDTIANTTTDYYSRIRNIELSSSNWVEVELSSAGTLGVEVLYFVDVLTDVELLKVKGPVNSTDWATIKQMKNLLAIDMTEAVFDAVPNNAFDGLKSLSNVKLPEGMKTIGEYAFRGTQIWDISIPSTVTSIGQYAFANTRLRSITFAEDSNLQSIANDAFEYCSSLQKFIMPNTVNYVGQYAFRGCTSLQTMSFSDEITKIDRSVCYDCNALSSLHLPANLTTIGREAFYNNWNLSHIDLPASLNEIRYRAFYNCAIDSVKLPVTLENLGEYAFQHCWNLKYVELPSYLVSGSWYDENNYYYDSYGYRNNFYDCDAIETIVMRSATPPYITDDPFDEGRAKSAITLKVPSFAVVNYKLDSYWYQFGNIIEGDDVDYWKITSSLSLTNNRRMQGKPDVDLYYGGQLTVGGNAPMETGLFNLYVYESNPGRLLNTCEAMTADSLNTYFSVSSETWYFFTPLHDVDLTKVTVSNGASYVFRYYDGSSRATNGTGNSWRNVDNGKLVAGQGYIFRCNANAVVTFPAEASVHAQVFNTSDVTLTLNAFEAAASANKSWNFVGNPYPCYFDIYYMDFTAPITVWTGSTYKAYSIVDDNLVLRPMQSFFVQKPDAVDNIVFHKEGRQLTTSINHEAAAAPAFRAHSSSATRLIFNIQIIGDEMADETRLVINDNTSLGYEIECDASKFMSFEPNVPQIFTLDGDGNSYAINERPLDDGTVKLAYYAGQSGFYTLSATRFDGDIYLHDGLLNKTVNLTEQDYTFHSDATEGVNNSRFTLSLGIAGGDATGIKSVDSQQLENDNYYDLQGRKVMPTSSKGIYIQNGRKVVK